MKKGFTLVELLGVIVLLGLIALISIPPLVKQVKKSKDAISDSTEKLIFVGVGNYITENKNDYPLINDQEYCITLQKVVDNGNLTNDLKYADGNLIPLTKNIKIKVVNKKYTYTLTDICSAVTLSL